MSRRDEIRLSDDEVRALLDEERTVICATNGRDGWPHLVPLWYVVRDAPAGAPERPGYGLWAWTYAKSQKVRNLERDPRATLQVEAGEDYALLRGVMLRADAVIHRDRESVARLGTEIFTRYQGADLDEATQAMIARQAGKRVGLQFVERHRVSWDHRKLGGAY